jgi:AGZA family xanthine/uracil permease-like MFS transporter
VGARRVGLSANTSIQQDGEVPRLRQALYVDSLATVVGAAVGSTSFVTFVESGVGIRAGARTGLAAVTTGLLLLGCLAFAPVVAWIPPVASAGALVYVAVSTLPVPSQLRERGPAGLISGAAMAAVTLFTSALDQALLVGLLIHLVVLLSRRDRPPTGLLVIVALLVTSVVVQYCS